MKPSLLSTSARSRHRHARVERASKTNIKLLALKGLRSLIFRLRARVEQADQYVVQQYIRLGGARECSDIPTWTSRAELRALFDLASACPYGAKALEIGSYLGASTCYIAAGLARVNGHLFCVDTWRNEAMPEGERDTFNHFKSNVRGLERYITPVRKRSDELTSRDVSAPLDFVFIDGDHSYPTVKHDFELAKRWLAKDGVISFHDAIAYPGVSRVIGEALASGEWMIAGSVGNLLWIKRLGGGTDNGLG